MASHPPSQPQHHPRNQTDRLMVQLKRLALLLILAPALVQAGQQCTIVGITDGDTDGDTLTALCANKGV